MFMIKTIEFIKTVNLSATLNNIERGEEVFCPASAVKESVLRVTASRLNREGKGVFGIEVAEGGFKISRT